MMLKSRFGSRGAHGVAGSGSAPWGRSLIARLLAVLLASGPTVSCIEVDVTAVDIAMLEVEPQFLSLTVGDTARLSATLRDPAVRHRT
jgi:hypothetical protein